MAETIRYTLSQQGLVQQGYYGYSPNELTKLTWGLRFTPLVCMLGAVVGLATQTPWIHFVLAGLGMAALALPAHHPLDLLYNHGIRHFFGGPKLPPNPMPRRIACALGGGMNLGIGLSFLGGLVPLAYLLGGSLIILQVIVISSHFCVASWLLEAAAVLIGRRYARVSPEEAHRLVAEEGALLVDVRSPEEFAMGHLPDAMNIPVTEFESRADALRAQDKPLLLYCTAGVRCHKAAEMLRRGGMEEVHELGPMKRWGRLSPSWS